MGIYGGHKCKTDQGINHRPFKERGNNGREGAEEEEQRQEQWVNMRDTRELHSELVESVATTNNYIMTKEMW